MLNINLNDENSPFSFNLLPATDTCVVTNSAELDHFQVALPQAINYSSLIFNPPIISSQPRVNLFEQVPLSLKYSNSQGRELVDSWNDFNSNSYHQFNNYVTPISTTNKIENNITVTVGQTVSQPITSVKAFNYKKACFFGIFALVLIAVVIVAVVVAFLGLNKTSASSASTQTATATATTTTTANQGTTTTTTKINNTTATTITTKMITTTVTSTAITTNTKTTTATTTTTTTATTTKTTTSPFTNITSTTVTTTTSPVTGNYT